MAVRSSSILAQALNSYIADNYFVIKKQKEFEEFWGSVTEYDFELTRTVYIGERNIEPDELRSDCLQWLAEKQLHILLRAKDIQDDIIVIEVMWAIVHRFDDDDDLALQAGPIVNLKIDRGS